MREIGLEADAKLCRVFLLQGFATRPSQFALFLMAIILRSASEASTLFSCGPEILPGRIPPPQAAPRGGPRHDVTGQNPG